MRAPQPPKPFSIGLPAGFIAGLIVGLLLGWFFHGVVGLFVRLGFALLLLIPLIIIVWFFFLRNRIRSAAPDDNDGMQVYTWSSGRGRRRETIDPRRQAPSEPESPPARPRDENVIDIEFEELKRQVDDEGTPR
jgi:hypothetical protein